MFEIKMENGKLILSIPYDEQNPPMSSTGKSFNIASTGGFQATPLKVKGKTVKINFTAIIPTK